MAKVRPEGKGELVSIFCPACDETHQLYVEPKEGRVCWGFNNDFHKPTFTPSLLVRRGHYAQGQSKTAEDCYYCNDPEGKECGYKCGICHSFIKDGMIQYLNDCTHEMAGQTVELGDI